MSSSISHLDSANININGGRRCAACKYLRRRCSEDCILAPYFHHSQPERFASVHRIFGAGNVARMLQQLPLHDRAQAADAIATEAHWRVQDPVYGCTERIVCLQHEISKAQNELAVMKAQIAIHIAHHEKQQHSEAQYYQCYLKDNDSFVPYWPNLRPDFI
ncbi:LOB domain-containing protein 24-like [Phalaenopsis equestris]|uniref:LOB domain-containing protein 24-like n=1 Tax=Phalaenopsis equestris TaxID=78828 RepID=UPI0009E1BCB7|nr:LOB domain-containing protein 24-like [Phalaenopsis equestris]